MCYFLFLASPLTLSEVRSMLPAGLTADLASPSEQQSLKAMHPETQTVARLLAGRCSCNLVRPRLADRKEDERHLRERYRSMGVPRPAIITALERHRQGHAIGIASAARRAELAKFVAEHARNAGSSLYYLHFSAGGPTVLQPRPSHRVAAATVAEAPAVWLHEASPTLVTR